MNRDLFTIKVCDLVAVVLLGLILAPWESVGLGWLDFGREPTMVAYIYESEEHTLPPRVSAAFGKLSEQGMETRWTDDDVTDGDGNIPKDIRPAIEAAREHGLPALVVLSEETVTSVGKLPETVQGILEAAQ